LRAFAGGRESARNDQNIEACFFSFGGHERENEPRSDGSTVIDGYEEDMRTDRSITVNSLRPARHQELCQLA
jgi:hypothetical protein